MPRRLVQATQSLCLSRPENYAAYAVLLGRLCGGQYSLTTKTSPDNRPHWGGRFHIAIRQLRVSPARLFHAEHFLFAEPFIRLAAAGVVSAHAATFERRIAGLRPDEWATAAAEPRPSGAGVVWDGRDLCLVFLLHASCVADAMSAHLHALAANTQPVHEQLADFACCLRRLARDTYPITMTLDERGVVLVDFDLEHLGDDRALYAPSAPDSLDLAGDCVLSAHSREVDEFVASRDADRWQRLATAWRFRHWGLTFYDNRARLSADASRVWHAINARLCAAASPTE